ncbi:peptidase T [Paenibacillus sp. IB182496]|uniref:Peptidase T n=1 Tax=Paenibacillus sabuli TaxID=2772509 RepID=A0A927BTQ1_9BACL|nr:peptidase T [Paenibacillus sabuli]MBD2845500.1 peptidase T [Paenibacillus sabuli]
MKQELIRRLSAYVQIDTQSNPTSTSCPSTPGQLVLAKLLAEELQGLGLQEITLDENGYLMATLPANTDRPVPTIGLLAHLDTATELSGANVRPQVVHYEGGDIVLRQDPPVVLSPREFPELAQYAGHTLITTDGTTLLGADNKAGIAEIMTLLAHLQAHPELRHGRLRVAFTPDEEIGRGPHRFDVQAFGADFAYTVDGGPLGELQYESFNAALATIVCNGVNVHPGTAKGKMVNAARMAAELAARLPADETPERTAGYEGFYHLMGIQGTVEEARLQLLIRDFDRDGFARRKTELTTLVEELRGRYGADRVALEIQDQYFNMREKIEPVFEIVEAARDVMLGLGIEPIIEPIRGGTDGSQLSYMGLPTPNLFTGGENYHGRYEYISADHMVRAVEVLIGIVTAFERRGGE